MSIMGIFILNVLLVLIVAGFVGVAAILDEDFVVGFIAWLSMTWIMACFSAAGWFIYAVVHFIIKYW